MINCEIQTAMTQMMPMLLWVGIVVFLAQENTLQESFSNMAMPCFVWLIEQDGKISVTYQVVFWSYQMALAVSVINKKSPTII